MSRSIGRSPLLSEFLLYVCDQHLKDKVSELTEQRIGVRVFGRTEGYNSNDDNIVRNYARTLRKRVDDYFATEGRHEDLRLEIPRGGYVPVFSARCLEIPLTQGFGATASSAPKRLTELPIEQVAATEATVEALSVESSRKPATEPIVTPSPAKRRAYLLWLGLTTAALILVMVAFRLIVNPIWQNAPGSNVSRGAGSEASPMWGQLFQENRDTFLVPADSGLVIMQGLTRQAVSLGDYASGSYRIRSTSSSGIPAANVNELGMRRYTSIVDLNLISHLARLKEVVPERMSIRYARDLRMDDLRSSNAILLGSVDSNPWEELFEQQLNFRFSYSPKNDTAPTIINQHPLPGEQSVYANHPTGEWHSTFGIVAYLPNLDGTGHVLLIGGLNMAGTQAAGSFVMDPTLMKPTLDHARGPDGNLKPFEILIETDNVAANASRPHVLSERIGPE
jgi:hypothetical protein